MGEFGFSFLFIFFVVGWLGVLVGFFALTTATLPTPPGEKTPPPKNTLTAA
jgi:hypothetical protein